MNGVSAQCSHVRETFFLLSHVLQQSQVAKADRDGAGKVIAETTECESGMKGASAQRSRALERHVSGGKQRRAHISVIPLFESQLKPEKKVQ
jgi:hypothetical protein